MSGAAVFVLTMQAVAGPHNSQPDGRRYDLLVFARAPDELGAEAAAREGLSLLGWVEAEVVRSGEITDPAGIPADLAPSYERALAQGCAVIVYDEP